MPFVSKRQYRWAFATEQPWARRWARETPSLTKLPARATKAEDAAAGEPASGGDKPMTPAERAKHAALVRWGKESPFAQRLKEIQERKKTKGKGKAPKAAGPTPEQIEAENTALVLAELEKEGRGLDKDGVAALQAFQKGGTLDDAQGKRLSDLGLVERDREGNYRMTGDGKSVANATLKGDARQALDALSRATDRMGERAEKEAARQQAEAEKQQKAAEKEKKGKGGGGGGGKKDEEAEKQQAEAQQRAAEEARAKEAEAALTKEKAEITSLLDAWEKGERGLNILDQLRAVRVGLARYDNAGNIVRVKPDVATKAEGYTPPQAVQSAARRALEQRAKQSPSNRGGTPVGLARARDLANGRSLSLGTVRRMKAFFDRHQGTKPTTQPVANSKWEQAWGLWGGNAGYRWARSVVARETKANEPTNPGLWAESIREAKRRFKVYPSAYANAWAARRYKAKGGGWRSATKDLREWFAEEWVDISRPKKEGGYEACGRPTEGMSAAEYRQAYPKCLPKARAMKLTEAQRLKLIRRKRRGGLPEGGAPVMTSSETKSYRWNRSPDHV
jgi:hypothetical protein